MRFRGFNRRGRLWPVVPAKRCCFTSYIPVVFRVVCPRSPRAALQRVWDLPAKGFPVDLPAGTTWYSLVTCPTWKKNEKNYYPVRPRKKQSVRAPVVGTGDWNEIRFHETDPSLPRISIMACDPVVFEIENWRYAPGPPLDTRTCGSNPLCVVSRVFLAIYRFPTTYRHTEQRLS